MDRGLRSCIGATSALLVLLAPQHAWAIDLHLDRVVVGLIAVVAGGAIGLPLLGVGIAALAMVLKGTTGRGSRVVAWITVGLASLAFGAIALQLATADRQLLRATLLNIPLLLLATIGVVLAIVLLQRRG